MNPVTDGLITIGLILMAVFVPRFRKPIGWLFAGVFVAVIALRLLAH